MAAGPNDSRISTPVLSVIVFAIVVAHAIHQLRAGTPDYLVCVCFVASAVMAVGLLLRHRLLLGSGFLWACLGLPLWLADSLSRCVALEDLGGDVATSIAMHVGGPLCGWLGARRLGLDSHAWIGAFGMLLVCQLAARLFTNPALNVNVVFQVRPEAAHVFSSVWSYWLACTVASALVLFALNRGLGYAFPKRAEPAPDC